MSEARNVGHVGTVGCSAEGAALCYRTICRSRISIGTTWRGWRHIAEEVAREEQAHGLRRLGVMGTRSARHLPYGEHGPAALGATGRGDRPEREPRQ